MPFKGRRINNKRIWAYIDPTIDANLRLLIQQNYNKYSQGLYSREVGRALAYWVGLHTSAQDSPKIDVPSPEPKTETVYFQVKEYIHRNYIEEIGPETSIPDSQLRAAITQVRGGDKRTVNSWIMRFLRVHLIRQNERGPSWFFLR